MKETDNNGSFIVHRFMTTLGLTPCELLVYALLYSYTKGKEGIFYASLDYIAEQTGAARRTVNGAVKKLLSEGLIVRCEHKGKRGLRADMGIIKRKKEHEEYKERMNTGLAEESAEEPELPEPRKRQLIPGRFIFPDVVTGEIYDTEPKYRYLEFGKDKVVKMTREQYGKLKSLISDVELKHYIEKLAAIHIEKSGSDSSWRKCDYKILREWISEDYKA